MEQGAQGNRPELPQLRFDFNSLADMESLTPPISVGDVADYADELPYRVLRALVYVAKGVDTPTLASAGDWTQEQANLHTLATLRSHVLAAFIQSFPKATGAKVVQPTQKTPEAPK